MTIRLTGNKKRYSAVILLAVTVALTWALSTPVATLPPIGPLVSPWQGFWQNMERDGIRNLTLNSDKLRSTVIVRYDERGVPHIFADNNHDLYFAQGLVTARDRLWQIDFQNRAAAGRLSEIVGPAAIDYDRAQRRLGMMYGAEINATSFMSDPRTAKMVQAYADGYNAWVEQLRPRDYPVEFKILNTEPEPFTPLNAGLLLMNMSQTLTSDTRAHAQTNARALLPEEIYLLLYPDELPWVDPIIPPEQTWDFEPIRPPTPKPGFIPQIVRDLPLQDLDPGIGSNSWAVDGSKTAGGYPILSNDPHLSVTLPSIWYEIQLHSNGVNGNGVTSDGINAYGVSLPGAPGVIIGFNENLAWGVTNTGSNTLDVFEIEFRDNSRTEYLHDGQWKPVRPRIEEIRVRGGDTVIDTVLYTHHGPVTQPFDEITAPDRFPKGHAIQWIAHLPESNVLLAVYKYNRARNQDEFETALQHFTNLPQNVTYADRDGNISIGHMGRFPVRFNGQGSFISDGRDPAYDWNKFVPFDHLPRSFNPERGFVSSANQAPATRDYPYYLGRHYAGFSRGARINEILSVSNNITVEFFEEMLMDNFSLYAEKILPFKLAHLNTDNVNYKHFVNSLINMLVDWDYSFDIDSPVALFFDTWKNELHDMLWESLFNEFNVYLRRPSYSTTFRLLLDGDHHVFTTNVNEAVNRSFRKAVDDLTNRFGDDPGKWHYGNDRTMRIRHLAMLPGFGHDQVQASGTPEAINATGTSHAPSWRMIVELGPEIRARGHFPGGQTGNPGHPAYDRTLQDWAGGTFHDLHFWMNQTDDTAGTASTLTLKPFMN